MVSQVNLHNHTQGSFVDGLSSVQQAAKRAKEVGSDAVAINDHNECNQHYAFQKACDEEGILPVLGMEADWVYDIKWTKDNLAYPHNRSHICLLAENDEGLSNLWAMSSLAYTDDYRYYKPLITPEVMREHKSGIWASDGCLITEFSRAIQKGDEELARHHFATLHGIFGDRFYSELHTWQFINPGPDDQIEWNGEMILASEANQICRETNEAKVRFANEMGVPLVIVNDSHHAWPEQWFNKELVWRSTVGSSKRNKGDDKQQETRKPMQKADHMMGGDELYGWMGLHGIGPEVVTQCIANSHAIAHSCTARIKPTLEMPRLNDSGLEDLRQLMAKCEQGFKHKVTDMGLDERTYFNRLQTELELIAAKQFPGYFLVVEDQVEAAVSGRWKPYIEAGARPEPVLCGPGRGSAGGSLVAYLTGITSIDPIHYDLLFERFLTPGRKGNPDIDCDFPQSQRGGEKAYLSVRYGHDHVCSIGTLTRSQPKALLKDLAKALGTDYFESYNDVIAMGKIIEHVQAIETEEGDELLSWADVVEKKGGDLAPWAKKYPLLFEKLNEMGGIIRQSSVHPSGVVVSNRPIIGSLPTRSRPVDGVVVTQFDMNEVEELGAVKLDLLGIRHLDTLMHARKLIYERHGVWLDYRRDNLPYEMWDIGSDWADATVCNVGPEARVVTFGYEHYADPAIWPQIDAGGTAGIFQLETPGLTRASMEVQPRNEQDVAALISIVRPGVKDAGLDKEYIARRHGRSPIVYDHPMMEPITKSTYGVLIYQEQLLRAARELAGFTPDEASDLQKALSKKKMDKVKALKEKFVQGCLANPAFIHCDGWTLDRQDTREAFGATSVIEKIWSSIEASGRYAFNKSHAVGYAVISTWEVWTKHYYPEEYLVALMATDSENVNTYLREARQRGIKVEPPDINLSAGKFTIGQDSIRYGLDTIRGVGDAAMEQILAAERPFTSIGDMLKRCPLGKTQMEALISIGALDGFRLDIEPYTERRRQLMMEYHDWRILMNVAEGKRAKFTEAEAVAHIAAWRELHSTDERYREKYAKEFAVPDYADESVMQEIEKDLVGNYILADPMARYDAAIRRVAIEHPSQMENYRKGEQFIIGGLVTKLTSTKIKKEGRNKGREMGFLTLSWNEANFEATLFPDAWERFALLLPEGAPVTALVKRDDRGCNVEELIRLDMPLVGSR